MKISTWESCLPGNASGIYGKIMSAMRDTGDDLVNQQLLGDAGFIWSVLWWGRMSRAKPVWQHYRSQNKPVIVAEVGGLVRDKTWRLSANGINRSAIFPDTKIDVDRPKKLGLELQPWHDGEYVLICGQHEKSEQWNGMPSMDAYYKQTVLEIRKHTDRPIVIRSHPRYRENLFFKIDDAFYRSHGVEWNTPKKIRETYDSFDLGVLLPHCHCVISHSSNSGIAAIMAGTPAIVSKDALAYDMGTDDFSRIESLPRPDRSQWLIELSHKEWFEDELDHAWQGLKARISP